MKNEVIGFMPCPLCGFDHQEIRKSEKSRKPYMCCDECGAQIFARQARSVNIMRDAAQVMPAEKPAPAKPDTPSGKAVKSDGVRPEHAAPVAKPKPQAVPQPVPVLEDDGSNGTPEEPTIFDWFKKPGKDAEVTI